MPRIRRWFHVSHDINSDPEVWELTDRFGERAYRVWMEILSIADRYAGLVPGDKKYLSSALAGKCKTKTRTVEGILDYCDEKQWTVNDPVRRLRNHPKYNPSRETKEIPRGKSNVPPPLLSTPPLPYHPSKEVLSAEPAEPAVSAPPVSGNGFDPDLKGWLLGTKHLQPLADEKHTDFWDLLVKAYDRYPWLYFEEQIAKADAWIEGNSSRAPTPRGMRRFMRSWFERAVEFGRKQHG